MVGGSEDRGVIFDFDGVLVDTGWAHKQSWYDLAEAEGLTMSDEFFYSTFGMQNRKIIPMLVGADVSEPEIERMANWKESRYRDIIVQKMTLSDEVRVLVETLEEAGFLMAVGSSAPRENLDLILGCLGLTRFFKAVVSDGDTIRSKPDPETFLTAAQRIGLPSNRCVVVEDAVQGVQAGKAGGMKVIAVTTTRTRAELEQAGADIVVDSLGDIGPQDFGGLLDA